MAVRPIVLSIVLALPTWAGAAEPLPLTPADEEAALTADAYFFAGVASKSVAFATFLGISAALATQLDLSVSRPRESYRLVSAELERRWVEMTVLNVAIQPILSAGAVYLVALKGYERRPSYVALATFSILSRLACAVVAWFWPPMSLFVGTVGTTVELLVARATDAPAHAASAPVAGVSF